MASQAAPAGLQTGRPVAEGMAIELVGVDKRFGPVHANRDVNLAVAAGTIHGIVGENGAGKSTLMKILYGFYQADAGEIRVKGTPVRIREPRDAIAAGIGMVHQHFMLVDTFTVLENLILGAEDQFWVRRSLDQARDELIAIERDYGLEVPPDARVAELPVGLQQRVEILKILFRGAETIILDEPTAVLTPQETDELFKILRRLKAEGKTVVLITHKLQEIMAVTDAVTVMRDGAVVGRVVTAGTSREQLAEMMVGRKVLLRVEKTPANPGPPVLTIEGLTVTDEAHQPKVLDLSLEVRAGEILGVAGVSGNGQTELIEALVGLRGFTDGEVKLKNRSILSGTQSTHPRELRHLGLGHVPEDRLRMGVIVGFEASETAILGYHDDPAYNGRLLSERPKIVEHCRDLMQAFDVRARGASAADRLLLRRQPAEAGAGARDRARPGPAAGRAADPRRRHRRHRVHPPAADRDARRGQGDPAGLRRARGDPGPGRPDRRHARGPDRRRDADRRGRPPEDRPADGRDHGGRGVTGDGLPRWVDLALIPLVNLLVALLLAGLVVLVVGENPWEGLEGPGLGRLRVLGPDRLHPVLHHQPGPSPAWPWRWPSTAACSTSAARARPCSAAWAWPWSA